MPLRLVTPPPAGPISLAEAKAHLRVDGSDEDELIGALILAAADSIGVQTSYGIPLVRQTWEITLPALPSCPLEIKAAQVTSIDSITYLDSDGATQTLSASTYTLVKGGRYASRLEQAAYSTWPATYLHPEAVTIRFTCGYEPSADSPTDYGANVPEVLKAAVKLLLAELYENRSGAVAGQPVTALPAVERLLTPFRVY